MDGWVGIKNAQDLAGFGSDKTQLQWVMTNLNNLISIRKRKATDYAVESQQFQNVQQTKSEISNDDYELWWTVSGLQKTKIVFALC